MSRRSPSRADRRRAGAGAALLAWVVAGAITTVLATTSAAQAAPLSAPAAQARYPTAPPPTPSAQTGDPTAITDTTATLNATVTPNEPDAPGTIVFFEYGLGPSYGRTTPEQRLTGTTPVAVTATLIGLAPATTYHLRLVAANGVGTTRTPDTTFTTAASTTITTTLDPTTTPDAAAGPSGTYAPAATTTNAPPSTPTSPGLAAMRIGNGGAGSLPTVTAAGNRKPIVRIPLICASGPACSGTVALFVPRRVTLTDSRTSVSIASGAFSIPSGTRVTLALPIERADRDLIAQAKRRGQLVTAAITLDGQPTAAHRIALANHARRAR